MSLLWGPTARVRSHEERVAASRPRTLPPDEMRPAPAMNGKRLARVVDVVGIDRIQIATAQHYGVETSVLLDRSGRSTVNARARRVGIYLAKAETQSSLSAVARAFNISDGGAFNAVKAVEGAAAYQADILAIRKLLEAA